MTKTKELIRFFIALCAILLLWAFTADDWGFYAHREIHYYAVMTIPSPANQFFKTHVEYLREHSVDPDRRRYAVPNEGPRHFMDLDRWYRGDTLALTRDYTTDRILHGKWEWTGPDTSFSVDQVTLDQGRVYFGEPDFADIDFYALRKEVMQFSAERSYTVSRFLYSDTKKPGHLIYTDTFSVHGTLPYSFTVDYDRLVRAMEAKDTTGILRICADIGHYIADAHVPLHTTINYNGQLTGQTGLHAFWESRIPELFAEDHFSNWAGPAEYIDNLENFIWSVLLHSNSLVPEVLAREIEAKKNIEEQNHFCIEERGSQMVRTQCPVLAREYMRLMNGMVEDQWLSSIRAVGSVWYSAWIDAGEPELWTSSEVSVSDANWFQRLKLWFGGRRK